MKMEKKGFPTFWPTECWLIGTSPYMLVEFLLD